MRDHTHHLFFGKPDSNGLITLDTDEARHAQSVLRVAVDDRLTVTNGAGEVYTCVVETSTKGSCTARVTHSHRYAPLKPAIHIYIGLPQRDAFEQAISMLVPFGVVSINPVICRFCQETWWEKSWEKHAQRFERLHIAALKQSRGAYLAHLGSPIAFKSALETSTKPVLYADIDGVKACELRSELAHAGTCSCFIGPPGGFAPEELEMLRNHNSHALWLAPLRLRTELASVAMVEALMQVTG